MSRTPIPAEGVGVEIRAARIKLGWTQHRLAEEAKVSRPTIARVEGGGNISTGTLKKIANALGKHLSLEA